jgi:tripartite-type tricarboxylate transporter receptor subunit TctC
MVWSILAASLSLIVSSANGAAAPDFPNKPVRIVAPGAGGSADFVARMLASGMFAGSGYQVVVDNRGNGVVFVEVASRATPDGYTVVVAGNSLWIGPLMRAQSPYDPIRDFVPVTLASTSPTVLVINAGVPAKSAKELIALARARPGTLNYVTGGTGSAAHLAAELFKAMAKIDMVRVAYKTNATQITDLLSGQVQLMFAPSVSVAQHIKADKLIALAITSAQPSALLPGLPTVAATGLPGYEFASMIGAFAPAKTPPAIVQRLNQEMVRVLNQPEVKQRFFNIGSEVAASSSEFLASTVKADMVRMGKVIREAGIREE